MPKGKPYRKRQRTSYSGSAGKSSQGSGRSLAALAAKAVAKAGEMKYFDTALGGSALATVSTSWAGTEKNPATFLTLCCPVSGDFINQRVGRKIHVHGIRVRGQFRAAQQATQSAADPAQYLRLLVVQDTQTNQGTATGIDAENVLEDDTVGSVAFLSYMNLDFLGRYKILKDKKMSFGNLALANDAAATGNLVQAGVNRPFDIAIKFKTPVEVNFNATNGGTVADIVDNSFHIIAAQSSAAPACVIDYNARVSYKD